MNITERQQRIKEAQNTYLVGRLSTIIKTLSGLDLQVLYNESETEMAYATVTMNWLTFKWDNGERNLYLDRDNAKWEGAKRQFGFSSDEKILRKVAKDIIKYINLEQQKG